MTATSRLTRRLGHARHLVARRRPILRQTAARQVQRALDLVTDGTVVVTEYAAVSRARWGWERPPHEELEQIIGAGVDDYAAALDGFAAHLPALRAVKAATGPHAPRWDSEYFSGLDACALYSFIVDRRPARYVEIGSGSSTRFARRAIQDAGLATTITSFDPYPRAEVDAICDVVHRAALQDAPLDVFAELEAGDIVFVDGSHVVHMDSDVVVAFTELLPRIPPGVIVGVDDIFLPWDYPHPWVGRWYGEQYLLAMLLLSRDPSWRVVFPSWWASNSERLAASIERFRDPAENASGLNGVAFWLERTTGSAI